MTWTQVGDDINGETEDEQAGWSVSLSADGSRLAIGAPQNDEASFGAVTGVVRVYTWDGDKWVKVGTNLYGKHFDYMSGISVSLSANGSRLAILMRLPDPYSGVAGRVRIYDWNGAAWEQAGVELDGETTATFTGRSLSLSADGSRVAIGSTDDHTNGLHSGNARVYGLGRLQLQNNGGDEKFIDADGVFTFDQTIGDQSPYSVTVLTHPKKPSQTCSIANGNGTVDGSDVTDVQVTCVAATFTIGGTVSGLLGSGLSLQNNGSDDLDISADGTFTFATELKDLSAYSVTVLTQPSSPDQFCVVTNDSGTLAGVNVVDIAIVCRTSHSIGGSVSGLAGSGLVLQNNEGDDLAISENGDFVFATPVFSGDAYAVSVLAQPGNPSQTSTVSNGNGSEVLADIVDVAVTCTIDSFFISGNVSGLQGSGLTLRNTKSRI